MTLPWTFTVPSGMRSAKAPPSFGSSSMLRSQKYFLVNSDEVSASHTFAGVEAM